MGARIRWEGLAELKRLLRDLPADLAAEATDIVMDTAKAARDDIYNAYPERTGNLRRGLKIGDITGTNGGSFKAGSKALGAGAVLYNNAPHAYFFEHGTVARHNGIRATGSMPAGNIFIPRAIRHRAEMYDKLAALLEAHGLEVRRGAA